MLSVAPVMIIPDFLFLQSYQHRKWCKYDTNSDTFKVTVNPTYASPPQIKTQPEPASIVEGTEHTLSIEAASPDRGGKTKLSVVYKY